MPRAREASPVRPEKLTLSGFAAYTEEQVVDFRGVDLFALSGPTGAGKSSLIDAIGFALYGAVPRFDDLRLVGAAVAAGKLEAKVRLDFTIAGVDHVATRVVRKDTKGRASTKEARLERGDEVLAGDADAVTRAVTSLLGLSFADFCRCVVLPQGAFAAFLHDKPSARQELLVGLLGAQLYGHIRDRAVEAQRAARVTADALAQRLTGDLADASPDALVTAQEDVDRVLALAEQVAGSQPRLAELAYAQAAASREADLAREHVGRLTGLRVPDDVSDLAAAVDAARRALAVADEEEVAAAAALHSAEVEREAAGDRATFIEAIGAYEALAAAALEHEQRVTTVAAQEAAASDLAAEATKTRERSDLAAARHEQLRQARAAFVLTPSLVLGSPCPVCQQVVATVPEIPEPEDWVSARAEAQKAEDLARHAESKAAAAQGALTGARTVDADAAARLEQARQRAQVAGPRAAIEAALLGLEAAETKLSKARGKDRSCRDSAAACRRRLEVTAASETQAKVMFDAARDLVASLQPPPPNRQDLAADWESLVAWAKAEAGNHAEIEAKAKGSAVAAQEEAVQLQLALTQLLSGAGVGVRPSQSAAEAAAAAVAASEVRRDGLAARVTEAERARSQAAEAEEQATVAGSLAKHLKADRFEKWLLDEAFAELLDGATGVLHELSGGAYSLTLDPRREFSVVDHRNADERRPVRTLSGGETFLASLALALSLADKVVALAPGQVRLESLFLDEGFGTLDPATLDTVAGAIEHLGSAGRLVGVVTHVRELAERLPIRFDVSRGPKGSTVERIAQ